MKRLTTYKSGRRKMISPDEMHFLVLLGKEFLAIRKEKNQSQETVSFLSGVSLRTIINIEKAKTNARIQTIRRLCQFYKVPMSKLLASLPAASNTNC